MENSIVYLKKMKRKTTKSELMNAIKFYTHVTEYLPIIQKGHSQKPHWFSRLAVVDAELRDSFKSVVRIRREFGVTLTKPCTQRSHQETRQAASFIFRGSVPSN